MEDFIVVSFISTLLYVHSSFAIILMGKRQLVALLGSSSWCLVMVVWYFLAVSWVCLRFVIVILPDHTHYFSFLVFSYSIQWENLKMFLSKYNGRFYKHNDSQWFDLLQFFQIYLIWQELSHVSPLARD